MKSGGAAKERERLCRSPQGERGLKSETTPETSWAPSRSPQGERGLKWFERAHIVESAVSLPARGAWIEIAMPSAWELRFSGRSPQGERGLKF